MQAQIAGRLPDRVRRSVVEPPVQAQPVLRQQVIAQPAMERPVVAQLP
ncbi:MAG TPA: hypothetical protein VEQ67_17010 [Mycobacterium sp.]|nr:hypothetical protein [Mycobacterium sp.]